MSGNFSFEFSSEDLFFLLTFSPSHCGGIIFQVKVTQIQVSGFPGMLTLRCSLMTWSLLALANLDRSPPQTLGLMLILTSFPEATPIMPLSIDHLKVYLLLSMALWASTLKYQQLTIWLGEWNFGRDQRRDWSTMVPKSFGRKRRIFCIASAHLASVIWISDNEKLNALAVSRSVVDQYIWVGMADVVEELIWPRTWVWCNGDPIE